MGECCHSAGLLPSRTCVLLSDPPGGVSVIAASSPPLHDTDPTIRAPEERKAVWIVEDHPEQVPWSMEADS